MTKITILVLAGVVSCLIANNCSSGRQFEDDEEYEDDSFASVLDDVFNVIPESSESSPQVCTTAACLKLTDTLLQNVDLSADPCHDMFQYVCGRMLTQPLQKSRISVSTFSTIASTVERELKDIIEHLKTAKDDVNTKIYNWFLACMNDDMRKTLGGTPLKKLLDFFGAWPAVEKDWNEEDWDLEESLAAVHRTVGGSALFEPGLVNNGSNVSTPLELGLFPTKLGLEVTDFYLKNTHYSRKVLHAYFTLLCDLAVLLGAEEGDQLDIDIIGVIELEILLAKAKKLENVTFISLPYTNLGLLKEASRKVPFDWDRYVRRLFQGIPQGRFIDSDIIYIQHPKYLDAVLGIIHRTPKRILANYIMSQVARSFGGALSSDFKEAYMKFYRVAYGKSKASPSWVSCVRSTNYHLNEPLGLLFVKRSFTDENLKQAEDLVKGLANTYLSHMDHVDWMDEKTRKAAKEKIRAMLRLVGYSKKIKDRAYLEKITKNMHVNIQTYFDNVLLDYQNSFSRQLSKRGSVPGRAGFDMEITTQNAQYSPRQNKVCVAAGLLQPPLFHKDYPSAVNFGGIGMAVGHEITHGFDMSGARFDKDGNGRFWWSKKTFEEFVKRANCIKNQYSDFSVYGQHVNGRKTLNENIADNGGLRISYEAYMSWLKHHGPDKVLPGKVSHLSSEQLFFVSFGQLWCKKTTKSASLHSLKTDEHCLSQFRVNGSLRNMKEFAEAFKCPVGSPMNPKKKCVVW